MHQEDRRLPFTPTMADYLYRFAFDCIEREYPNKPAHVLGADRDLLPPRELHPCFYGCFDWHSAVHGHWTLVTLLRRFPGLEQRDAILEKLRRTLTRENVRAEVAYFEGEHNAAFERPYGWAWLLALAGSLRGWEHPAAAELSGNLLPLETLIANRFVDFLDVLGAPVRAGTHANTAFALSLAYDHARENHPALARAVEAKARAFYLDDRGCPLTWEPGGFDFLSPCLQEAALMRRVLPEGEFVVWFEEFLPGFADAPGRFLEPVEVTDRSDGHLAHLDGLNFSRAWCLFELAHALGNERMRELGVRHFVHSYAKLNADEYAGSHWLATFATYALTRS
jgi:hypothetical protein